MTRAFRWGVVVAVVVYAALSAAGLVRADVDNSTGTNVQQGDNSSASRQQGASGSGDANGGQVVGVVSSGRTSVDATNRSVDSEVASGEARGSNEIESVVGLNGSSDTAVIATDIKHVNGINVQEGDNRLSAVQTASQTTGDGVAGQVIGVVTGAEGSASVVASNTAQSVSASTGDAEGANGFAGVAGLNDVDLLTVSAADIASVGAHNIQEGDNRVRAGQSSTSTSGDGVAGQVIGVVSNGATSVDASNTSSNIDVASGNADASNSIAAAAGHVFAGALTLDAADISTVGGSNVQEGDNSASLGQAATAATGDGVGGQIIGSVTAAGGEASIVAATTSSDSDVATGDATAFNDAAAFAGLVDACFVDVGGDVSLNCLNDNVNIGDIDNVAANNVQEGDNRLRLSQAARAQTGDGVAGMILGVVSAGRASVDARNVSDDVSVETGDAEAGNHAGLFVGLGFVNEDQFGLLVGDVSRVNAENTQDGNNSDSENQDASAVSGDAVGGLVSGVVTAPGGSASVVLDNTSRGVDVTSGVARFFNAVGKAVGLVGSGCSGPSQPPGE